MEISKYSLIFDTNRRLVLSEEGRLDFHWEEMDHPYQIRDFATSGLGMQRLPEEYIYVIGLDSKYHPLGVSEVGHGTVDACPGSVRSIMIRLLLMGAVRFCVVHNHPSGDPTPSVEDYLLTDRLRASGELLELALADHVIVAGKKYWSLTLGEM